MYFHWGYCEYILFKNIRTTSYSDMIAACVAVFILSFLHEGLKASREYMLTNALVNNSSYLTDAKVVSRSIKTLSCGNVTRTFLYMLQVFLGYCLMMVFMTLNIWLCMAVVIGAALGYFIFSWMRSAVDNIEHCH